MASIVACGLFNAIAFAGAGFLFSKLNHKGYEDEIKRHNKAIEKLARAKEKWYEPQVERKNKMAILRQELNDANKDIDETNMALDELKEVREELSTVTEPTLDRFYEPSDEMKHYQNATVGSVGLGLGYVVTKVLSKVL